MPVFMSSAWIFEAVLMIEVVLPEIPTVPATVSIRMMLPVLRLGREAMVSTRMMEAVLIMAVLLPEIANAAVLSMRMALAVEMIDVELPEIGMVVFTMATFRPPLVTPIMAVESSVGSASLTIWACIVEAPMATSSVQTMEPCGIVAGPAALLNVTPSAKEAHQHWQQAAHA